MCSSLPSAEFRFPEATAQGQVSNLAAYNGSVTS